MRFLIITLIIAAATFGVQLVLPWWSLAIVAFIVGYLSNLSGWGAWGAGLLGCSGVWFFYALWFDVANQSLLSAKLGAMFGVPYPLLLALAAGVVAGLIGSLATLGGRNLRQALA